MTNQNQTPETFVIKKTPGIPNPIDIHVGERIRLRRTVLGMSQEKLGQSIGLTFQQIQKYERGLNRVGSSRLWGIAHVLGVPIDFFFEELEAPKNLPELPADPMKSKKIIRLVRAFNRINDENVAENVFNLIETIAGPQNQAQKIAA